MKLTRRLILAAGAAGFALSAAPPADAQEKIAKIGIAIPAATHRWTGGLNFHTERTIKAMEAAFPQLEFVLTTAGDVQTQVNNVEDLIAQQIDALVILPMESAR